VKSIEILDDELKNAILFEIADNESKNIKLLKFRSKRQFDNFISENNRYDTSNN